MEMPFLPAWLVKEIKGYEITKDTMGCSIASVYRLAGKDNNLYLKIHPQKGGLKREYEIMNWLYGKVPVPEIVRYDSENEHDYLLMSEITGEMSCAEANLLYPERTVKLLAEGIKMFHSISLEDCPIYNNLDLKLTDAAKNVKSNMIDLAEWKRKNGERSHQELLEYLMENKPETEELVFTHGDYCLPNVFFKEDYLSGFIDMGHGGIADPYQDISLCIRSIRYNLKSEKYVELFIKEMDINENWDKINYYILLDDLL